MIFSNYSSQWTDIDFLASCRKWYDGIENQETYLVLWQKYCFADCYGFVSISDFTSTIFVAIKTVACTVYHRGNLFEVCIWICKLLTASVRVKNSSVFVIGLILIFKFFFFFDFLSQVWMMVSELTYKVFRIYHLCICLRCYVVVFLYIYIY